MHGHQVWPLLAHGAQSVEVAPWMLPVTAVHVPQVAHGLTTVVELAVVVLVVVGEAVVVTPPLAEH